MQADFREMIPVGRDEVSVIRKLAHRIWPHTFKEVLSPAQIDYMLEMMYTDESLREQLRQGCKLWLLKQEETPVGFLSLEHHKACPGLDKEQKRARTKIHKIYLLPEIQGSGAGRFLMDFAAAEAIRQGDQAIYLNVNRNNKAIAFYEHYGLDKKFTEDIDIGDGFLMEDWVMEKKLL